MKRPFDTFMDTLLVLFARNELITDENFINMLEDKSLRPEKVVEPTPTIDPPEESKISSNELGDPPVIDQEQADVIKDMFPDFSTIKMK